MFVKTDIDKKLTIDYLDENGVLSKKQIAKVSKISSHVARRTFCTENYRRRQDCEEQLVIELILVIVSICVMTLVNYKVILFIVWALLVYNDEGKV